MTFGNEDPPTLFLYFNSCIKLAFIGSVFKRLLKLAFKIVLLLKKCNFLMVYRNPEKGSVKNKTKHWKKHRNLRFYYIIKSYYMSSGLVHL